uniref:Uncharacterized protein n=1 Tax=Siphoviridae sp. ctEgn5 TaxID=2825398 RepID=A0A8S5PI10_9CAUD|nr:MAG TPA: hypothetical protein [Siphoviridae sp. ctEgn5]
MFVITVVGGHLICLKRSKELIAYKKPYLSRIRVFYGIFFSSI